MRERVYETQEKVKRYVVQVLEQNKKDECKKRRVVSSWGYITGNSNLKGGTTFMGGAGHLN
jgi:hypothetical protein